MLASNPGRITAEIPVTLPQPRNRLDPAFRALVDDIYARMTARPAGKAAATSGAFPGTGISMLLPRVSPNLLAGLMETVAAEPFKGHADLPLLAAPLRMEIDDLFPVAESLQLLRFAEVAAGDIRLTEEAGGSRFVQLDLGWPQETVRPACSWPMCRWPATSGGCSTSAASTPRPPAASATSSRIDMSEENARPDLARGDIVGPLRRSLRLRRGERRVQPR